MNGPVVILVRPQLGENIGAAARAMKNFGLEEMRIVAPRDGWPNPAAEAMAVGAADLLARATVHASATEAVADLDRVWATTARLRHMLKPVVTPRRAARDMRQAAAAGAACGILYGPERSGLDNDEVALADAVLQVPTAPDYASLNLAQAVLLTAYEWLQQADEGPEATIREGATRPATKGELEGFFGQLVAELDDCGFLRNRQQRPVMIRNLRNVFLRAGLYEQEVRTLRGVVSCLASGRKPIPPVEGS